MSCQQKNSPSLRKRKAQQKASKKAKWTSADDATLIEVLRDQQSAGNQADNGWKKAVWVAAVQVLAGSEKLSGGPGGAAKKAKSCQDRFSTVSYISDNGSSASSSGKGSSFSTLLSLLSMAQ
jgi:hypothetical protein